MAAFVNPYQEKIGDFSHILFEDSSLSAKTSSFSKIVLEIGSSSGKLLHYCAAAEPNTAFIGLELKYKMAYIAAERAEKLKLQNLFWIRGEAERLEKFQSPASVDELWIFFPDPWAKKKQWKHRLVQPPFLHSAARILKPGAKVYIKTDHPGYFQWILAYFGIFKIELAHSYQHKDDGVRSFAARQIKVRKLHEEENLPKPDLDLQKIFNVETYSENYQRQNSGFLFDKTTSLFEDSFLKQNLPIYFIELKKTTSSQ